MYIEIKENFSQPNGSFEALVELFLSIFQIREFKGKTYIDIREWYVDKKDMETKPGKKGVSLNAVQFQQLRSIIEEVNNSLP